MDISFISTDCAGSNLNLFWLLLLVGLGRMVDLGSDGEESLEFLNMPTELDDPNNMLDLSKTLVDEDHDAGCECFVCLPGDGDESDDDIFLASLNDSNTQWFGEKEPYKCRCLAAFESGALSEAMLQTRKYIDDSSAAEGDSFILKLLRDLDVQRAAAKKARLQYALFGVNVCLKCFKYLLGVGAVRFDKLYRSIYASPPPDLRCLNGKQESEKSDHVDAYLFTLWLGLQAEPNAREAANNDMGDLTEEGDDQMKLAQPGSEFDFAAFEQKLEAQTKVWKQQQQQKMREAVANPTSVSTIIAGFWIPSIATKQHHVCVYVCMYVCVYIYICMYVCLSVCMCVRITTMCHVYEE